MSLAGDRLNVNASRQATDLSVALQSMTGYGRGSARDDTTEVSVEIRSVNGKGLDIRLKLPGGYDGVENDLRSKIKNALNRGSLSVSVYIEKTEQSARLSIDNDLLERYAEVARSLTERNLSAPATADGLMALKGVILQDDETHDVDRLEADKALVFSALGEALEALKLSRLKEGQALEDILKVQIDEIGTLRDRAANLSSSQPGAIRDRLKAKLDDLLPQGLDEDRLTQEAAMLAVKADIREELDRLGAHIEAAKGLIEGGSPCGRKLDFLAQEFNRECNTLCSKSSDREMTETGLALKAVIDQMREQIQNVE